MTAFEFVFPLFGLMVGLSLVEMLSGLARALKTKRDVRVGWLTPLLGLVVLGNLTLIWLGAWDVRNVAMPTGVTLLLILSVGGSYFLAASLVFPESGSNERDLDEHFMANRTTVLLIIAGCNFIYLVRRVIEFGAPAGLGWWLVNALFLGLLLVAAFARNRRLILTVLLSLVVAHLLMLLLEWR